MLIYKKILEINKLKPKETIIYKVEFLSIFPKELKDETPQLEGCQRSLQIKGPNNYYTRLRKRVNLIGYQ